MRYFSCLAIVSVLAACEATTPTPRFGTSSANRDVSSFPVAPEGTRGEFSRGAAAEALRAAGDVAKSQCSETSGPIGLAKIKTTFDPGTGKAISAVIVDKLFDGTSVGECIARTFLQIELAPYNGSAISVTKSVRIE